MAFLTRSDGRVTLLSQHVTLVGASPECHIQLASIGVEPQHARIVRDGARFYVEALDGSTQLNDEVIHSRRQLAGGDWIRCAGELLRFAEGTPRIDPLAFKISRGNLDLLIQFVRRFPELEQVFWDLRLSQRGPGDPPTLIGNCRDSPECIESPVGDVTTIGRNPVCDIRLADRTVSRRHAQIVRAGPGDYYLEDLRSANGTLLNGRRLVAGDRERLSGGDRIDMAACSLRFQAVDERVSNGPQQLTRAVISRHNLGVLKEFLSDYPEFEFLVDDLNTARPTTSHPGTAESPLTLPVDEDWFSEESR